MQGKKAADYAHRIKKIGLEPVEEKFKSRRL
jgi:hypothetical protein